MDDYIITVIALTLATMHFGVPLAYYIHLRRTWLPKPWNLKKDPRYEPKVSVIVPTYNEEGLIEQKLDDIYRQDYPRDKLGVVVVDSASTDGTPGKVREWALKHPDLKVRLVEESVRRGKVHALNTALKHIHPDTEVVILTDADSFWSQSDAVRRAVAYLADPIVGAVSCLKKPAGQGPGGVEEAYRSLYNQVRLAESKAHSTPIFHGELAAYKRSLLEEIGGFPEDLGADDSHTATLIALKGYRAITPEDIWCTELVPSEDYSRWRIRRAQHLLQHFQKAIRTRHKVPNPFRKILIIETYLHIINPWLLLVVAGILVMLSFTRNLLAIAILTVGSSILVYRPFRTWVMAQLYLIVALIRNLYKKEIIWEKQTKQ